MSKNTQAKEVSKTDAGTIVTVPYTQRRVKKDGTVVESTYQYSYVRKGRGEMKNKVALRKNIKSNVKNLTLEQLKDISKRINSYLKNEEEEETIDEVQENESEIDYDDE